MAKHDRNQTRKMFAREMANAAKEKSKKQRKSISPEVLRQRFEHIVKNPSDTNAVNQYKRDFRFLLDKAKGSTATQMRRLLDIQLGILAAQTADSLKGLKNNMAKLTKSGTRY